jgi:hypothetical protein
MSQQNWIMIGTLNSAAFQLDREHRLACLQLTVKSHLERRGNIDAISQNLPQSLEFLQIIGNK